jgi:LDH2 family malate/lactate/ureidoglycolate dehydrogenase
VFAEEGANKGALTIVLGGGSHKVWKQVAPYGGIKGMLPTNPYAMAIPGDEQGPVVFDFATGASAGGWIMAAKKAGAMLPEGLILDAKGNPTVDPHDYINGGSLLPAAGCKGYGMALIAELVGFAMLGQMSKEEGIGLHMLVMVVDTTRFQEPTAMAAASAQVLREIRACPPAAGFHSVEIPGQRENIISRKHKQRGVMVAGGIWAEIAALANTHGVQLPETTRLVRADPSVFREQKAQRMRVALVGAGLLLVGGALFSRQWSS